MRQGNKFIRPLLTALGAIAIISGISALGGERAGTKASGSGTGNTDKLAVSGAVQTDLAVAANRCRGCGKCVRLDPEHFALDAENRTAIVISTENLDSANLKRAKNNCDGEAIVIS